jgi:hypothetical protein
VTFSSRLVGGAVGTSRVADTVTDTTKVGSRLADFGEETIVPWLARTAEADHIGGKALRGLGWIGKQHSKIPGYDWVEGRLAQAGGATAGALGLDPRIGMLVGTIAMPDIGDLLPGLGSAVGSSTRLAKLNKIAEGKYFKGIPRLDTKVTRGMATADPSPGNRSPISGIAIVPTSIPIRGSRPRAPAVAPPA